MNDSKWRYYINFFARDMAEKAYESKTEVMEIFVDRFIKLIPIGSKILDIGSGRGTILRMMNIKRKDLKLYGITLSKEEVFNDSNIEIKQGDMHEIPYNDNTFDGIFCKDVLEHSVSPPIALLEMNRVLKDQGIVYIIIPGEIWIKDKQHIIVLNEKQLDALATRSGFRKISSSTEDIRGHKGGYVIYAGKKIDIKNINIRRWI